MINPDSIRAAERDLYPDPTDIVARPPQRPWQRFQPPTERFATIAPPVAMTEVVGFVNVDGLVHRTDPPVEYPWLSPTKPRPWQEAASAWRRGAGTDKHLHPVAMLEMGLGCVTGDTVVTFKRGSTWEKLPIEVLHRRWHGISKRGRHNHVPGLPTSIRALKADGTLGSVPVLGVIDTGVKPIVRLKLASGATIRCTPDHEIVTPTGKRHADQLKPGDAVLINGKHLRKGGLDKDGYIRLHGTGHPREGTGGVYEHILVAEKMLGRLLQKGELVHHKNEVKHDNRRENLEVLTGVSEHWKLHKAHLRLGVFLPKVDQVVSVESAGDAHVFDIGVNEAAHTYIANGIVVGNTGKSLIAIEETLKLKKAQGGLVRALFLVPNSTMDTTWATELPKHSDLTFFILSGTMKHRRSVLAQLKAGRVNYDVIVHNTESYPMMAAGPDGLNSIFWDLADIDEIQDFRNPTAERAKALLGRGLRYRDTGGLQAKTKLANTATLVIKKATNVYAPFKWLANCFGAIGQFRSHYVVMGGFGGHQELGLKPDMAGELKAVLDRYRFVCPPSVIGLPEPVFHTRRIDLPDWQRAIYRKVQDELKTEVDGQEAFIMNKLTEMMRLAQVTAGIEAIDKDTWKWHDENAKAAYLFDTLLPEVFAEQDRAIVWVWFRPEVSEIARMARERGYRPVMFWGGDNIAKVTAQNAFKSGEANLFIGQMKAGGRGLNFGESKTMIYLTRSFDTEAYMQSLGRDMRTDSVAGVRNRIIVEARDTVDQHITGVLRGDIKLAELLSSVRLKQILGS